MAGQYKIFILIYSKNSKYNAGFSFLYLENFIL